MKQWRSERDMSEQPQSASVKVAKKVAVLALVVAAIGLPINDVTDYAILLAAAVLVFVGSVNPLRCQRARWTPSKLLRRDSSMLR